METSETPDIELAHVQTIVQEASGEKARRDALSDELNRWEHQLDILVRQQTIKADPSSLQAITARTDNTITRRILEPIVEEITDKSELDPGKYGDTVNKIEALFKESPDKEALHKAIQTEWNEKNSNA
jgi:hypothetical protein